MSSPLLFRLPVVLVVLLALPAAHLSGPASTASARAASAPHEVCRLYADKSAQPQDVAVGDPVQITLSLDGKCPPAVGGSSKADIVLVIDRSSSQLDNGTWDPTVKAAGTFLDLIDYKSVQVGIVAFEARATVNQMLTSDAAAAKAALAAIPNPPVLGLWTDITTAVTTAQGELTSARHRADAQPVMVLLSDGEHNALFVPGPIGAATAAKNAGTTIITIGLTAGAAGAGLMRQLASSPDLYFEAPTGADLERAYRDVAGKVSSGAGRLTELAVVDILPSEVALVAGSAAPPPDSIQGRTLTWRIPALAASGWVARYTVRPLVAGSYSPNKLAYVDYLDGDGSAASRIFPLPNINVHDKTQSAIFLPILQRSFCKSGRPFDVVLVLDTSSSMRGDKLTRTRAAAREFLAFLDMPPSTAAVVAFSGEASVVQGLTADRAAALAALDNLPAGEGTRIDLALKAATRLLVSGGRDPSHAPVVILITDGRQAGSPEQDALNAASGARRAGATVFTIGIGPDAAQDLLTQIAGDPERFYNAPTIDDLLRIYRDIAGVLPCRYGD